VPGFVSTSTYDYQASRYTQPSYSCIETHLSRAPSSSSGSTRSLRRTQSSNSEDFRALVHKLSPDPDLLRRFREGQRPVARPVRPLGGENEGSTTPDVSRRPSAKFSWWRYRITYISNFTASLSTRGEALRKLKDFTHDLLEKKLQCLI